ncbi:unnamed protein product [Dovyalis caffra]|uniref:Nucleolar protein 16 n=1 Tax=Dovyalis caffra TaxID=77055 RepID=A0AAV1STF6_9ROSI|nr:unnamed protein product [Dovyalis caffra]
MELSNLKSALGKKRREGEHAPLRPLTKMQRVHIDQLVENYGHDYRVGCQFLFLDLYNVCGGSMIHLDFIRLQGMFMDIKLNAMQHSVATLEKLCKRYHMHNEKNPLIRSTQDH